MLVVMIGLIGLALGSFVNACAWRMHEQETVRASLKKKGGSKKVASTLEELSISKGRSMCPHCRHTLSWNDLIPVLSWVELRGKCRYCRKPISAQYPLVEILVAATLVMSYLSWPWAWNAASWLAFGFWAVLIVIFAVMAVYDFKWFILPDRLVFASFLLAFAFATVRELTLVAEHTSSLQYVGAILVSGGLFYVIFQVSNGKWIGGGDVKLGAVLGLLCGTALMSTLMLFFASCLGSLVAIPLMIFKKAGRNTKLPFGPFLIVATIIVLLYGARVTTWYEMQLLGY